MTARFTTSMRSAAEAAAVIRPYADRLNWRRVVKQAHPDRQEETT